MHNEINYQNNPLHGVGLKQVVTEIADHYGFEILYAYLGINCFKMNPSVDSSIKFLKKTDWAREKVESFYLYEFKNLPRASADQYERPPRDRVVPAGQSPGEPSELSLEDAERLREKRAKKFSERARPFGQRAGCAKQQDGKRSPEERRDRSTPLTDPASGPDPWAKWRK